MTQANRKKVNLFLNLFYGESTSYRRYNSKKAVIGSDGIAAEIHPNVYEKFIQFLVELESSEIKIL